MFLSQEIGELLFTDILSDNESAEYSTQPCSYIVDLHKGPFQGQLSVQGNVEAKLLDRGEQLEYVVNEFKRRAEALKGSKGSDKSNSPATVVAQAPGAGKSHFLAELGDKVPDLYDLQNRSKRPIVSVFNYNSAMTRFIKDWKADLVLRMLYGPAVHMSSVKCEWRDFVGDLALKDWIIPILPKCGITLAVDILRE